jgi:hypothetical protein
MGMEEWLLGAHSEETTNPLVYIRIAMKYEISEILKCKQNKKYYK